MPPALLRRTPADSTTSTIETLLRELLAEMRGVRADLAQERRPNSDCDDVRFLTTIAASVGGRVFSASELLAHGQADAELRDVLGGLSSRQIGKRLRSLTDRPVGGYVVRRIGRDATGTIWAVQVSGDLHALPRVNGDAGA